MPPQELILVEGESAGTGVTRVCDPTFQTILALQGKPRNPLKASRTQILASPIYAALLQRLGLSLTDSDNLQHLPFDRILLLFDPDADGIHCGMLMTWFFYRWLPTLLDSQRITLIQAPPFLLTHPDRSISPLYAEKELQRVHPPTHSTESTCSAVRGLASLPDQVLLHSCVQPSSRREMPLSRRDAERSLEIVAALRPHRTSDPHH